jgi:hypothetical protein
MIIPVCEESPQNWSLSPLQQRSQWKHGVRLGWATHTKHKSQHTHTHKRILELKWQHRESLTRIELKSLTQRNECAGTESGCLRILSECLCVSFMRLGVPIIAQRQLGAVGGQFGRPNLPFVGWCTRQSGAPPDSPCSCPVRDLLPFLAHPTVGPRGQLAHWTLSGAHQTVRCPLSTVAAGHASPVDCAADRCAGDRWLTGQSGAPPDSLVNYSRTPLIFSRERPFHRRPT